MNLKPKLDKTLEFLRTELTQIRTGRAHPSLLENVEVEAYGGKMKIKELGSVTLLDNQTLLISPWDKSLIGHIVKAVREGEMRLNPVDDGSTIKVPLPSLSEERRRELAKLVSQKEEDCKIAMRNIRQEEMKEIDKSFADKEIGEDEKFRQKEEVEKVIKDYISNVEELSENKKTDLMTV